ncbi:polyphosphate polymerase domain-containing protein [Demequina sp. NBRC 110057]|uniref:polyphosphate polymerase domain-containing protein n=1 Tax=Demequina sp. NBRC 110057 TaxID=1570346 RepID=UPI000A001F84|nr:polyphosphate polymerase domain-containing protein [Demequina sp. NBRC 110057]
MSAPTGDAPDWDGIAADLAPVGLAELDEAASLQHRVDRKYLVSRDTWAAVLADLDAAPRILEMDGLRRFRYSSVYYDTPELDSYRAAAHRRPRRFKVRTRRYVDTGGAAVEVKLRSRAGDTVKHRLWLPETEVIDPAPRALLPAAGRRFVATFPDVADALPRLGATLTTAYERSTLLTADARVTVDDRVTGTGPHGASVGFAQTLIVETKSPSRAGDVDRALWRHGARPQKVSKYCTSLAALEPTLPSNRWSRTLRGHVTPVQPALAGA